MSNYSNTLTNDVQDIQVQIPALTSAPTLKQVHRRTAEFKDILLNDLAFTFRQAGNSLLTPSAYDTAWVARLSVSQGEGNGNGNNEAPLFPEALAWLTENQHPDGSWGNGGVLDRLMPTLAALIALRKHSRWLTMNGVTSRDGGSRGNSNGNRSEGSSSSSKSNHLEAGITYIWAVASHLANGTGPLAPAMSGKGEGQAEDASGGDGDGESGSSERFGQPVQPVILPVAFELVLPTLLQDARALGLNLPQNLADRYEPYRQEKLKKLAEVPSHNLKYSSAVYSLEFCGSNLPAPPETLLHVADGGVGVSVAATAWLYLHTPPDQVSLRERMYRFLLDNRIPGAEGGGASGSNGSSGNDGNDNSAAATSVASAWPVITCIDTFEWIWAYYNLHLWQRRANVSLEANYPELQAEVERCMGELYQSWSEKVGLGTASRFLPDSDSTAMAYLVLQESRSGNGYNQSQNQNNNREVRLDALAPYWREPGYLVTYAFERDPSTSANIHALEALTVAGRLADANRLVAFLEEQRRGLPFWQDKWHISPYYPTSHALIAYCRLDTSTTRATAGLIARWIIQSQNPNGSWGWETRLGTMEETAYALQALIVYAETYGWSSTDETDDAAAAVPASAAVATVSALLTTAKAGADYLRREYRPYVWEPDTLWISKTRYSPLLVVRSAVLSAILMAEEHRL
jgi:hypothetical protein